MQLIILFSKEDIKEESRAWRRCVGVQSSHQSHEAEGDGCLQATIHHFFSKKWSPITGPQTLLMPGAGGQEHSLIVHSWNENQSLKNGRRYEGE